MSKLKTPLLSLDAHGTLADTLTFQKRSGTKFVRRKPTPTDPQSTAQLAQRDAYQRAAASWNPLTDAQKAAWNMRARPLRITGFNLYLRYLLKLINNLSNRWAFMEGSGVVTRDSWGIAQDAVITGASFVSSKWGYSLLFDGLDDHAKFVTPDSLKVTSQDFSIITRLRPTAITGGHSIFDNEVWSESGYAWYYYSNAAMYLMKCAPGVCELAGSVIPIVDIDVFQILGVTRQGNDVRFYKNGVDVTFGSALTTDFVPTTVNTFIAQNPIGSYNLKGDIDFVLFFNGIALSPAQMLDWAERTL